MQKENHLPSNLCRGYVRFVEGRFPDWMIGKVPRIFPKKIVFHHVSLVERKVRKRWFKSWSRSKERIAFSTNPRIWKPKRWSFDRSSWTWFLVRPIMSSSVFPPPHDLLPWKLTSTWKITPWDVQREKMTYQIALPCDFLKLKKNVSSSQTPKKSPEIWVFPKLM